MEKNKDTPNSESKKIKAGGKEFDNAEQLAQAYDSLSKTVGDQGRKMGELKKALIKDVPEDSSDYTSIADELYDKPAEILQRIERNIIKKVTSQVDARSAEDKIWDGFFDKNKELAPLAARIKNDTYTRLWGAIKDKTVEEQFDIIAKEWSPFVAKKEDQDSGTKYRDQDPSSAFGKTTNTDSSTSKSKDTDSDEAASLTDMLSKRFG